MGEGWERVNVRIAPSHIREITMPPTEPPILTSLEDGVLTITLNRPPRLNAFTAEMHHLLLAALKEAQRDPGVRVIVIAGAGRGFCAGYDVAEGGKPAPGDDIAVKW